MIRTVFLFVVLGLGLYTGSQYAGQQGYVLISVANTTIEMSVTTFVIFTIALLAALFGLEYLIKKTLNATSTTWNWFNLRRLRKARHATNQGMIKLLEGDFTEAERLVKKSAKNHDLPLLSYLVASEAALGNGDRAKRDMYLQLASEQEDAQLAVQLTQAKQHVQTKDYELAFAILSDLKSEYPNNRIVIKLLKEVYLALELWQPLIELLPQLKKLKIIDNELFGSLEVQAYQGFLSQLGSDELSTGWKQLPRKLKTNPAIVEAYGEKLIESGHDVDAFRLVKDSLKKHPSTSLFALLPKLARQDPHPVQQYLHKAIGNDVNNAEAYSALGQIDIHLGNWQQAQTHFEHALSLRANIRDYKLLADALEQQNMTKAAQEVSRKALTLVQ